MSRVDRYHSALHERDNRCHIYSDCPNGNRIKKRCRCAESPPDNLCGSCDERLNC